MIDPSTDAPQKGIKTFFLSLFLQPIGLGFYNFFYFLHRLGTQNNITHEDKMTLYNWFFDDPWIILRSTGRDSKLSAAGHSAAQKKRRH